MALFPRRRGEPIPTFGTLDGGKVIKVSGDFGVDYGFLSALETTGDGEALSFRGTAASAQDRPSGLLLSLGGKREVRYQQYGLSGEQAASLRVGERLLTLELPSGYAGAAVTVTASGVWGLDASAGDVKLTVAAEGRLALTVPKGVAPACSNRTHGRPGASKPASSTCIVRPWVLLIGSRLTL